MQRIRHFRWIVATALIVVAAGAVAWEFCPIVRNELGRDLNYEQARTALSWKDVGRTEAFVTWRAKISVGTEPSLEDTLPEIDKYRLSVDPVVGPDDVTVEIFSSTEKAGQRTDGWIAAVAKSFNKKGVRLSNGKTAKVRIRHIPSGTAYQFIAGKKYRPDAFSPSNHLWIRMVEARGVQMTQISKSLVGNIAGVVTTRERAARLKTESGTLDIRQLIDDVVQGRLAMGYTDPFLSSTGLNFLVTVLQTFAKGETKEFLSSAVTSAFEAFQRGVPFVTETTMEMRTSMERGGSLHAFVMEYQTFANEPALKSRYEFIPFGARHDNPLYAVGSPTPEVLEVLNAFADLARDDEFIKLASDYGFNPPTEYRAPYPLPAGEVIIDAQHLWKAKKDAGRPLVAIVLCDVSGSMEGSRIRKVRDALRKASAFITEKTVIGMASFANEVKILLPPGPFDLNQKASFFAAVRDLDPGGDTGMYDGIAVALSMLAEEKDKNPALKPRLIVLTDGKTNTGLNFEELKTIVKGLGIPVHTIGFEADLAELERLSELVEAASLDADEGDIAYELGKLFNAQL